MKDNQKKKNNNSKTLVKNEIKLNSSKEVVDEYNNNNISSETQRITQEYLQDYNKKLVFIFCLTITLFIAIIIGMTLGSVDISFYEVLKVIFSDADPMYEQIIWKIRLPRILSAVVAGMALAISGVTMQIVLRNPLSSPFTLGISNAAAFGAGFAVIILGAGTMQSTYSDAVNITNPYIITLSAFICCLIATIIILLMIKIKDAQPKTIILMGIVLGSLFSAGNTALQYFSDEVQLAAIVHWTFGDLGRATWAQFYILCIITVFGAIFFINNAWNYNSLNSGDDVARSLGVNINQKRTNAMLVASLLTSASIAFFGIITYVGLVVPHIVRKFIGNEGRFLIIATMIFGGLFLVLADTLARTILSPIILPVGVITSFLGAPLFIYLLLNKRESII